MAPIKGKSKQNEVLERALAELRQLGGELFHEEDLVFEGQRFVIPETMNLKDAKRFIEHKLVEDEEMAQSTKVFRYRWQDGAHATEAALRKTFGTIGHHQTMGFWGPEPPQFRTIEIGHNHTIEVPWGTVSVPALPDTTLELHTTEDEELGPVFAIVATHKKKRRFEVQGLFRLIEDELNTNSIYRGKSIDAGYHFLDTSRVDPEKVVYAEEVRTQLEANIFARLRHPDELRRLKVPLKGAVLLYGNYGVGKTLAAYLTAQEAERSQPEPWTFILVRPDRDNLTEAMATAQMYEPSVVFFEDVDRVASAEEEGDRISALLDLFDGARAKGREVMAVLTTNFVEKIHKGMVRPGRLDAVIEVTAPDHAGLIKLTKTVLPEEALDPEISDEEWDRVGHAMEGFLPAFVTEAADRAVRYLVVRSGGKLNGVKLTADDLVNAALGLRPQLELMAGAKDERTRDPLAEVFVREVAKVGAREGADESVRDNLDPRILVPQEAVEKARSQL